jgi:hypothetical protein
MPAPWLPPVATVRHRCVPVSARRVAQWAAHEGGCIRIAPGREGSLITGGHDATAGLWEEGGKQRSRFATQRPFDLWLRAPKTLWLGTGSAVSVNGHPMARRFVFFAPRFGIERCWFVWGGTVTPAQISQNAGFGPGARLRQALALRQQGSHGQDENAPRCRAQVRAGALLVRRQYTAPAPGALGENAHQQYDRAGQSGAQTSDQSYPNFSKHCLSPAPDHRTPL